MLSTPVSGVATRNATVAPGVAPSLRSPSAVGRTPQEHKGNGAPRTDPQSTDLIFPAPTSRVSSRPGTRTASTPASRKPKRRKTEASSRIPQTSRRTANRKLIIIDRFLGPNGAVSNVTYCAAAAPCTGTAGDSAGYLGRYLL